MEITNKHLHKIYTHKKRKESKHNTKDMAKSKRQRKKQKRVIKTTPKQLIKWQ